MHKTKPSAAGLNIGTIVPKNDFISTRKASSQFTQKFSQKFTQKIPHKGFIIGNRIPRSYFITKGKGESDITVHAGSYHLALKQAGIESYNIMVYSSIMPGIAQEVARPATFAHGSVMETIMAVANAEKGESRTAGIVFGWLYNRETEERFGGLVCEYHGALSEKDAGKNLDDSLMELYTNGFEEKYELKEITLTIDSFTPQKKHGTVLVAICFVDYFYPIIDQQ